MEIDDGSKRWLAYFLFLLFIPFSAIAAELPVLNASKLNLKLTQVSAIDDVPCVAGSPPAMGSLTTAPGHQGYVAIIKGEVPTSGKLFLNVAGFSAMYKNPVSGELDMSYPDALCIGQDENADFFMATNFENAQRGQHVQFYRNDVSKGPIFIRLAFFLPEGVEEFFVTFPVFVEE